MEAEIVSVSVFSKVFSLDSLSSMSKNLEYRAGERQRKRESQAAGQRSSTRNSRRQRSRAREKKTKETFFVVGRTTWKFCSGGEAKWEKLGATNVRWKWAAIKNTYDISSIKRTTIKEVSGCLGQNDGKEMYKISELHVQSCFFFANYTYCCFSTFFSVAFAA